MLSLAGTIIVNYNKDNKLKTSNMSIRAYLM